jgi:signal transduction histidine kinase
LLDAGRTRPQEIVWQDIVALINRTVSMLNTQNKNHKATIEILGIKKLMVACDTEQITQVLLNLLINAMQAAEKNVHIQIKIYQQKQNAIIEIHDNGPGIPQAAIDKIFDPFFTQRKGGIGLGLAVVKKIIEAHQGKIEAGRSELGGALFKIRLPIKKNKDEQTE